MFRRGFATSFAAAFAVVVAFCGSVQGSSLYRLVELQGPPIRAPPEKCCMPNKWTADMFPMETFNSDNIAMYLLQVDYDNKKQALLNFSGSFETPLTQVVIDFGKHMMYIVDIKYPQYCQKIAYNGPLVRCIPDDAEYLGSTFLGSLCSGLLMYDGWRIRTEFNGTKVISTLARTQKGCVPIVEGVAVPQTPSLNHLYMFSTFQAGLTNPSAFDLPDSCFK